MGVCQKALKSWSGRLAVSTAYLREPVGDLTACPHHVRTSTRPHVHTGTHVHTPRPQSTGVNKALLVAPEESPNTTLACLGACLGESATISTKTHCIVTNWFLTGG